MIGHLRNLYATRARARLYERCLAPPLRLILLRYHSVAGAEDAARYVHPGLSVSPARFREHLRLLTRRFRIAGPDEIPDLLAGPAPRRPAVVITFDDGYRDNHEFALPILVEEGATAVFFITTGPLAAGAIFWVSELRGIVPRLPAGRWQAPGSPRLVVPADPAKRHATTRAITTWLSSLEGGEREAALDALAARAGLARGTGLEQTFLTAREILEMARAGMTIGAHTVTHPHLDRLAPAHVPAEVARSRQELERITGGPVRHFAYPNPGGGGRFTGPGREAVVAAGFMTAATSTPGPLGAGTDLFALPRLGVNRGAPEEHLFARLARIAEG